MFLEQLLGEGDEPGGIGSAGELGMLWRGWEKWVITWDQTVGAPEASGGGLILAMLWVGRRKP